MGEDAEDNAIMKQCKTLYEVWSVWESDRNPQEKVLLNEVKAMWDYDFYKWAKAYSKRRALREPAETTIDNKIAVYRDYIAEALIEPPPVVFIPKRDEYGKLTDPDLASEDGWEEITPDFSECDYGKLLVSKGPAKRREMTPEAWSALFDPFATVSALKENLGQRKTTKEEDDFHLVEINGVIYACTGESKVAVMQILFEAVDDGPDLFEHGIDFIFKTLRLRLPVDY